MPLQVSKKGKSKSFRKSRDEKRCREILTKALLSSLFSVVRSWLEFGKRNCIHEFLNIVILLWIILCMRLTRSFLALSFELSKGDPWHSPNVEKERWRFAIVSDQTNFTVSDESQLNRCRVLRNFWLKLVDMNGASGDGEKTKTCLVFHCIKDALLWLSCGTAPLVQGQMSRAPDFSPPQRLKAASHVQVRGLLDATRLLWRRLCALTAWLESASWLPPKGTDFDVSWLSFLMLRSYFYCW